MRRSEPVEGEEKKRGVVPGRFVRVSAETARVGAPGQCHVAEPQVELIREGDVVVAIDVTCPCGRRMHLRCIY